MANHTQPDGCVDLCSPVRNRYFYGKLLDVFHFELEQNYFNTKRWLLNRLIAGYGVVCGLGVSLVGPDNKSVIVSPGVAIDQCGHEIIVCQPYTLQLRQSSTTEPAPSASSAATGPTSASGSDCCDDGTYVHLSICYYECETDPVPALGGDCDTQALCTPGAIRERYQLKIEDGKLCPPTTSARIQEAIYSGLNNYAALASYVSRPCPDPPDDCCIPLANIRLPDPNKSSDQPIVDITVRPIVYTNDLLYKLILAWMNQGQSQAWTMK